MRRGFSPLPSSCHGDLIVRIAGNLRRIREERGWSQLAAAKACGFSSYTLECIEAAEASPSLATLAMICDGFGIEVEELFRMVNHPIKRRARGRPKKSDAKPAKRVTKRDD